jgi:hypothetical protein
MVIAGILAILAGGAIASTHEGGPVGALIGVVGLVMVAIFIGNVVFSGLLIAGGISILGMKANGRRLTLTYAWIASTLHVLGILVSGFTFTVPALVALAYPIVLIVLLNQPDWKAAFP